MLFGALFFYTRIVYHAQGPSPSQPPLSIIPPSPPVSSITLHHAPPHFHLAPPHFHLAPPRRSAPLAACLHLWRTRATAPLPLWSFSTLPWGVHVYWFAKWVKRYVSKQRATRKGLEAGGGGGMK